MPVVSPGGHGGVVLPLPPPDTGEESEEEATTSVWSGFGKYAVTSPPCSNMGGLDSHVDVSFKRVSSPAPV